MLVTVTPEASAFISAHGGVAYVKPRHQRCCHGTMTLLDIGTAPPPDAGWYETASAAATSPDVRYWHDHSAPHTEGAGFDGQSGPTELAIELRGRKRPRLVAFWDGCAYKP